MPTAMKDVWFIVVLYRPSEQVGTLLKALNGRGVVVVDNTAAEYQISKIKYQIDISKTQYIQNKTNVGYGAAANKGIRAALKEGAQWVVVLNQDITLSKQSVGTLDKFLRDAVPGIHGPFAGTLDRRRWTTVLSRHSNRTDYISGACMAVHAKVFEKIGLFYEPYFMYYEDADLSVRAKRAGFALGRIELEGVTHTHATSLGKGSFLHEYYLSRNHLLFVARNAPLSVKIREYLRLPRTVYAHLRRGNSGGVLGIRDFLLYRFGQIPYVSSYHTPGVN